MNKPQIFYETSAFLDSTGLTMVKLAQESGVHISTLSRFLAGERKDIASAKADALRAAMRRISMKSQCNSPASPTKEADCHG